jgi:hypothetical protein
VSKLIRPSAKKWYGLVIPDVHIGYEAEVPTHSEGCWDILIQALKYQARRLTHVIILGDFGQWPSLTHWASLRADQAFIEEDVALVNARLDEIESITKPNGIRVRFCEGNHEAWASQFESKYPGLRDMINLKKRLRFQERGWLWYPENIFYALGDCHFTHGHVRGVKCPADMVRRKGVSVLYGHTHQEAMATIRTLTGEHFAMTCGCLASIDPPPPYTRGETPDTWVQGFGNIQVRANGRFQVGYRRILDEGWTELEDGTELIADQKAMRKRATRDRKIMTDMRRRYKDRYYVPGGAVQRAEPHHGKARTTKKGELIVSPAARTRRARFVRPEEE